MVARRINIAEVVLVFSIPSCEVQMILRENVHIAGSSIVWKTNLSDAQLCAFVSQHGATLAGQGDLTIAVNAIRIPVRTAFLPFLDGICLWVANGNNHSVLYRSHQDEELWRAKQNELEELREEQRLEAAASRMLLETENAHLLSKLEAALAQGEFDKAAEIALARIEMRQTTQDPRLLPSALAQWDVIYFFSRFPSSRYGLTYLASPNHREQEYANFARWFEFHNASKNDALVREVEAIFKTAISQFPHSATLYRDHALFLRRRGFLREAIAVCQTALQLGLKDGSKTGFAGRIARLERELSRNVSG